MGITFTVGKVTKSNHNFTEIKTTNNSVLGFYKPCTCGVGEIVTIITRSNGTVLSIVKGII